MFNSWCNVTCKMAVFGQKSVIITPKSVMLCVSNKAHSHKRDQIHACSIYSHLKMILLAAEIFLPPYSASTHRGRVGTSQAALHPSINSVTFQDEGSNISVTPSEQKGITISVHACREKCIQCKNQWCCTNNALTLSIQQMHTSVEIQTTKDDRAMLNVLMHYRCLMNFSVLSKYTYTEKIGL